MLKSQYNGAKAAGLKVGFFHFLRANDPTLEAKHFLLVRWTQQRLVSLGFSVGKTGTDSYFGPNTLLAVKKFQASRGLKQDGIVGPLTTTQLLK